jgi:Phosphotransferase enzyme family
MPPPRRALSPAEVQAVCAAYSLGDPVRSVLVHEGTSSLYRTVCTSSRGPRAVALKVQDAGESVSAAKHLEARVLSAIRPAFPLVPVLLRPGVSGHPARRQEWGLVTGQFAVSAYEWVEDTRPWRGTARQRQSTVAALGLLQDGLKALSSSPDIMGRAKRVPSILDIKFSGFAGEFARSERRRRQGDPRSGLDERQLGYLDGRLDLLHQTLLGDWHRLAEHSRGLVHADFTPGNCGYDDNDAVTIVFDFESVRVGVLPLFGATAVGTFSISHEAADREVVAAMRVMADGLRHCSPPLSPPPGLTVPLLRLAYLDAARRQLAARRENPVRRWGFLRENLKDLRWLDDHAASIADI